MKQMILNVRSVLINKNEGYSYLNVLQCIKYRKYEIHNSFIMRNMLHSKLLQRKRFSTYNI